MKTSAAAFVALAVCVSACGPRHVAPFTPRQRVYAPGKYAQGDATMKPTVGSLFSAASPGFLEDTRAVRTGDTLLINIAESSDAQGDSNTNLSSSTSSNTSVTALMGLLPALKGAASTMNPAQLMQFASQAGFTGSGTTERSGQLNGQIAVRVSREMPNGDLFIEGSKVVLINNEEYHLYLSGLVRPSDIAQDNSIASTRIADAQIEFTGRGDLADQQRKGWLARILDTLNPF